MFDTNTFVGKYPSGVNLLLTFDDNSTQIISSNTTITLNNSKEIKDIESILLFSVTIVHEKQFLTVMG
eukprot:Pgem_evm1s1188